MVIMSVSKSKEKAMLNTVSVLRRLLRNAFLVTNRVNVMSELQGGPATCNGHGSRPGATSINEATRPRQPCQSELTALSYHPFRLPYVVPQREITPVEIVIGAA